jgi:hypothetical protein
VLNIGGLKSYPEISNPIINKGLNICGIAFKALFEDTKHLVTLGVRADIAHRKATASSREELSEASSRAVLRESSLASWVRSTNPLQYGQRAEKNETFKALLEAVSLDDHSVHHGLPN